MQIPLLSFIYIYIYIYISIRNTFTVWRKYYELYGDYCIWLQTIWMQIMLRTVCLWLFQLLVLNKVTYTDQIYYWQYIRDVLILRNSYDDIDKPVPLLSNCFILSCCWLPLFILYSLDFCCLFNTIWSIC